MYAIECAMDELAYAAKIDPLALRLLNYSDQDQIETGPTAAKSCANATGKARRSSAGPRASHSRARCATAAS